MADEENDSNEEHEAPIHIPTDEGIVKGIVPEKDDQEVPDISRIIEERNQDTDRSSDE